ncbi:MAG TPA: ROK family transcriptional regulator [Capillimicrobium sp.]|nr:ROK family transcriptional regulator [Capillimicrobium sp.]
MGLSSRTGSLESLREHNLLRVIDVLLAHGVASRAEIARQTGLSRTTVSTLVTELIARGLVAEREPTDQRDTTGAGRPPVLLALDRSAGAALGIDIGHSHLRVAVADLSQTILAQAERALDVDQSASDGFATAIELVEEVLAASGVPRDRVINVGMGVPGPIRHQTGSVGSSSILPGWVDVRVGEEMERRLGLPVVVENDANLGALGEALFGAGRGAQEIVYLKVSTGIGAGLIVGGRIHHGAGGTAGELGHLLVDEDGHVCRCGNRGCLETVAATPGLLEQLSRTHGTDLAIEDVIGLARGGDPGCRRVIADAGQHIGRAVAMLCNLLNPARIIVGGDLSAAGDLLLDPLRGALRRYAIPSAAEDAEVSTGLLGEQAEVRGAIALAIGEADRPLMQATGGLAASGS